MLKKSEGRPVGNDANAMKRNSPHMLPCSSSRRKPCFAYCFEEILIVKPGNTLNMVAVSQQQEISNICAALDDR
jgi:hypothetical protein